MGKTVQLMRVIVRLQFKAGEKVFALTRSFWPFFSTGGACVYTLICACFRVWNHGVCNAFCRIFIVGGCAPGTYAEYYVANKEDLARMPANVSFEEAAGIPLAGLTAYQVCTRPHVAPQ